MGTPLKNNQHKNINNASQELLFKYTSLTGLCLFVLSIQIQKNFIFSIRTELPMLKRWWIS